MRQFDYFLSRDHYPYKGNMSKSSEMFREIDQSYKNLLDKFNPTARQIITAGKAYLKALHGVAAASKVYLESISKLSDQVEQCPTRVSSDIGSSLEQVVDVYREIHSQQNNILKAFYVDFLVPLESNLEKDAKVLQTEHKKFLSTQKSCQEALMKAEGNVRKQRKKKIGTKNSIDKEIKNYQILDEERLNYDLFMDQSFREISIQERRRYNFVLERLCILGRHHMALYSKGTSLLQKHLDNWASISTRGQFDPNDESSLFRSENEGIYSNPEESLVGAGSGTPTKRRSHSLDGYLSDGERHSDQSLRLTKGFQEDQESSVNRPLSKAKSDYNLKNYQKDIQEGEHQSRRSSLEMMPERKNLARATFRFQATADNQLTLEEGDVIILIGERAKGWQYGENHRTHKIGWFPVAYTECLEEEDSALGYSYNIDPLSLQSKVTYEVSKEPDSPYLPPRDQSLDRLGYNNCERRVRGDISPSNPPKRRERSVPLRSSSSLHQIMIEEEKGRTYYSIPPPPGSSCTSDNKKSYETFNSHLFLTDDMEEDLDSYEGSYRECRPNRRYHDKKITNFGADNSQIPATDGSLTSPNLRACFRKSVSSRDSSAQSSEDSGFSKEENKLSTSSFSESCSKSFNSSWVTDSYDACSSNRNIAHNDCYNSYQSDGKCSPTFLRYLYPSYKDSASSSPIRHPSVDVLDRSCIVESKKENWIATAFGTLGKKKKNLVSPCAQKIASQKARKKNEKSSLHRSSSLLCLDMTNCTSSPEETYASNYEDITYTTWHHKPKVEVLNSLPSPPPYDPPPLPNSTAPAYVPHSNESKSLPWSLNSSSDKTHSTKTPESSSSGNSSWSESEGSGMEAYMVVKERDRNAILDTEQNQRERKKILTRSYTWASPDFKKTSAPLVTLKGKKKEKLDIYSCKKQKSKLSKSSFISNPFSPQHPLKKKNSSYHNTSPFTPHESTPIRNNKEDNASPPPLPPRGKPQVPLRRGKKDVNIFNYSEFMCQRLTNPDGTCRFDQRSYTTGQKCSAWYDLWGSDGSVGKLV